MLVCLVVKVFVLYLFLCDDRFVSGEMKNVNIGNIRKNSISVSVWLLENRLGVMLRFR